MTNERNIRTGFWHEKQVVSLLLVGGQLAFLTLVALAVLWPAPVDQGKLFAAWSGSDLIYSHWPFALQIQGSFAQTRHLPFWSPYFGGGLPVGADPLAALFYPPTLLVYVLSLRDYFLLLVLAHLVFAGLGTLLLARRALKLPRIPALIAAVSFMATPRLIGHLGAGHVTIVQTVAWYPWLALACWATVREPRRWGAWLSICIGLILLAGHPQMAYYGLLMVVGQALWLLVRRWRTEGWARGRRSLLFTLALLAVAGVIGVLLAAVHLLPLMELTAHSTRQLAVRSGDAVAPGDLLSGLLSGPTPLALAWEGIFAPGLALLVLALFAVVTCWRKVWPLVLGIVLVAGLAMGNASPFYLLASWLLPGLDLFRGLARIWFVALLLIALLAGVGSDSLLRNVQRLCSRKDVAGRLLAVLKPGFGLLIVLLVALSLVLMDIGYARTGDIRAVTTPSALARAASLLAGPGRVYSVKENISQTNAVQLGMRLADGSDPLLLESYALYMRGAGNYSHTGYALHIPYDSPEVQPNAVLLGWMNVSVVVSPRPLIDPHFVQAGEVDGVLIYRNTADAGPAYLLQTGARGNPPALEQFQRLASTIRVVTLAPEQEIFTCTSDTGGYLVLATPQFPGWSATLDGHPVAIQLVAGTMPAIRIGPGTHTLSYTYTPTYVLPGATLSASGLGAALAWLLLGRLYGKRRGRQKEEAERSACQVHDQLGYQQEDQVQAQ